MVGGADDRTQQLLAALASPIRREILWLVWDRELTAGEITAAFVLTAPTISTHLAVLRRAGLVTVTRSGTYRRYRAVPGAVQEVRSLLGTGPEKYRPRQMEERLANRRTVLAVVADTVAPCNQASAYEAFTDERLFARWMGVPLSVSGEQFATRLESGVRIRGLYDLKVPPCFLTVRWDFDQGTVPLPGDTTRTWFEFEPVPTAGGEHCRVEVTQLARTSEEAGYLEQSWGMVLARFTDHVLEAFDPSVDLPMRTLEGAGEP